MTLIVWIRLAYPMAKSSMHVEKDGPLGPLKKEASTRLLAVSYSYDIK